MRAIGRPGVAKPAVRPLEVMASGADPRAAAALDTVTPVADSVLFEGYLLYPYRANDTKNRLRWQFGVLVPPGYTAVDPSERDRLRAQCVLDRGVTRLTVRVRFLHVARRRVTDADDRDVPSLDVADVTHLAGDEASPVQIDLSLDLPSEGRHRARHRITVRGAENVQIVTDRAGIRRGALRCSTSGLEAELACDVEPLPGPYGARRLEFTLTNRTAWSPPGGRADALRSSLVATHLVAHTDPGVFLSAIDPPEWARGYTAGCEQSGVFPVLAGRAGDRSLLLCSPIILYDHPRVAPESAVQFCDSLEMDELLTLRTATLTDSEKRQVRGSDPRAAALLDQVDHLPPELLGRLHGAIRSMDVRARPAAAAAATPAEGSAPAPRADPAGLRVDPDADVVLVGGFPVSRGVRVRLHPRRARADAQDMFLAGRSGTVQAVLSDLDGDTHLAVSLDDLDDLAGGEYYTHGRYLYFAPDEVEPIGARP